MFKDRVRKWLEVVGGAWEGLIHRRENRLAFDSARPWRASDAAITVICKGK